MLKKLPIGLQTFSKLIEKNCVYIDKTELIHHLITQGEYYFLARPRRFGKSLLVSTLAEIFAGNKDLFAGLAIESLPYDWKKHPVISISFADLDCTTPDNLNESLKNYLYHIAQQYDLNLERNTPAAMLQDLIRTIAKQNTVALLIDEYDYAILKHVHNPEIANEMRESLKNFYAVIKGLDKYLAFVFLTGVSRFAKTSIFSGLNNLEDISLSPVYNAIAGYTEIEIIHNFEDHLIHSANLLKCSVEQLLKEIKTWYDGYQFTYENDATKMYNPFSVLLFLKNSTFSNYWFETGTPTFLINLLKAKNYPIQEFDHVKATKGELGQFEVDAIELKTLLFQTGYITIKEYNSQSGNYTLGFPNKECIDSLAEHVMKSMTTLPSSQLNDTVLLLRKAFEQNTIQQIYPIFTSLFASIPYTIHIGEEKYYQTIFYLVLKMIGAEIIVEEPTNIGRIDAIIQTKSTYFIIEFKINTTAKKALEQIKTKKYYQAYESMNKSIVLIGIAFDTTTKNISDIEYEQL
ncbi:MAG TPA: AAA family ATPase [Candidatus Babeliales bacterium]|nr:AAA family ATPase [Candidatus Babeliales bacterium]